MGDEDRASKGGWRRALWGGLLSLAVPGLGQVYAQSWRLGAILWATAVLSGVFFRGLEDIARPTPMAFLIGCLMLVLAILLRIGASVDAMRRGWKKSIRPRARWVYSTWLAVAVAILVDTVLSIALPLSWRTFSIPSGSTIPTLMPGDMIATKQYASGLKPELGDMIVFKYPRDTSVDYVKRVVGLPGDRVALKNGRLIINGQTIPTRPVGDFVPTNPNQGSPAKPCSRRQSIHAWRQSR